MARRESNPSEDALNSKSDRDVSLPANKRARTESYSIGLRHQTPSARGKLNWRLDSEEVEAANGHRSFRERRIEHDERKNL